MRYFMKSGMKTRDWSGLGIKSPFKAEISRCDPLSFLNGILCGVISSRDSKVQQSVCYTTP